MVIDAYVPTWEEKSHSAPTSRKWTTSLSLNMAITTLMECTLTKSEIHTPKEYNGGASKFGYTSIDKLERLKEAAVYAYSEKKRHCI